MVSFQCSPLATAEGIQSVFRQCARYQKNKNMDAFVSVVVLDMVGLAEDSSKLALNVCILFPRIPQHRYLFLNLCFCGLKYDFMTYFEVV